MSFTREFATVGETTSVRLLETRQLDGMNMKTLKKTHLRVNREHKFKWKVLMCAPKSSKQRKNLEASIISINAPSLNNQLETKGRRKSNISANILANISANMLVRFAMYMTISANIAANTFLKTKIKMAEKHSK